MIVDTTQSKIEWNMMIADIQEQLQQIVNEPNLTINCHCGKIACFERHCPKLDLTNIDQYICRHS